MSVLPRSTPSGQQIDASGLLALLDRIHRDGVELHSLMVVRHGAVVAEGGGGRRSRRSVRT